MVVQNPLDRVLGDVVAEIRERATDARVPPRWILDRHPHHEVGHLAWRYRPASTSVGAAVVLPGNQPPVPAENRVRRDDAGDLRQHPPAEFLASHRESTALGVGQAKWTWATLLPEDPILLPERIDHVFLVAVHPASGREYEEAQSVGHSLRLLGEPPLAPTWFRRFANLGRFVAPYGNSWVFQSPLRFVVGIPLALLGGMLAVWGMVTVGWKNTSGLKGGFVSDGLYRFTRNPQYVGDIVFFIGVGVIANSVFLWIVHLLLALVFVVAPLTEEPWLEEQYGNAYREYRGRVPRFL